MGNVHAYSSAPPPPPPSSASMHPICQEVLASEKTENPGPLEELHQKCKSK